MANRLPAVDEFVTLRGAMDRLFNESFVADPFRSLWSSGGVNSSRLVPLDVYETQDAVVVLAAAPGVSPEAIEITVNKGTVTLSGQIPNVAEAESTKGATWHLHELAHGTFRRTLTLPFDIDTARAEATFEHGMLRLELPKAEAAKPQQIKISVAGSSEKPTEAIEAEAK